MQMFGSQQWTARVRVICAFLAAVVVMGGLTLLTASSATAETAPSVTSDKADYAPGELVTLTGAGWEAGESVHLTVDDELGRTWQRQVDVIADEQGEIVDAFNLPDWFVATYTVVAEGSVSGTVNHSFTDGNVKVYTSTPAGQSIQALVAYSVTADTTVCPAANPTNTVLATSAGVNIGGGANEDDAVKLVAPASVSSPNGTHTFAGWTVNGTAIAGTNTTLCTPGQQSGTKDIVARYTNGVATNAAPTATVVLSPDPATTNQTLTATATKADTDGDTVTLTYVWKVGTTTVKTTPSSSLLSDTLDMSLTGNGNKGETVSVTVTPNDTKVDGAAVSDSLVVANSGPSAVDDSRSTPRTPRW